MYVCNLPAVMQIDVALKCLHFDAIAAAAAVEIVAETGNYRCLGRMCIVATAAQSVAVQIENHFVHLVG